MNLALRSPEIATGAAAVNGAPRVVSWPEAGSIANPVILPLPEFAPYKYLPPGSTNKPEGVVPVATLIVYPDTVLSPEFATYAKRATGGTNVTVGCVLNTVCPAPGFAVTVMVFTSAIVDAMLPKYCPFASVTPGALSMLPVPLELRL